MAFAIWIIEKEFNVGPVTKDFPLMKIWNLFDEYNLEQWKKSQEQPGTSGKIKTMR
jgi:hypothetical protein